MPMCLPKQKRFSLAATILLALAPLATGPALAQTPAAPPPTTTATAAAAASADTCKPSAASLDSRAGKEWLILFGWRFANPADAAAAWQKLVAGMSPWTDWDPPVAQTLGVGTRFAMAMAPGQGDDRPGGFGTFDRIGTVAQVRDDLAVRRDWKPSVDHVVIYEVVKPLPVLVGPIGPQVDPTVCEILPGRWSQFQMQVPPAERASYLRPVNHYDIR